MGEKGLVISRKLPAVFTGCQAQERFQASSKYKAPYLTTQASSPLRSDVSAPPLHCTATAGLCSTGCRCGRDDSGHTGRQARQLCTSQLTDRGRTDSLLLVITHGCASSSCVINSLLKMTITAGIGRKIKRFGLTVVEGKVNAAHEYQGQFC